MGLRDILFGRKQLKEASPDRLFALSTAQVTLEVELGLRPGGSAAVVFKPLSAGEFTAVERDLNELVDVAARDSESQVTRTEDSYGYQWLVVRDPQLEDLVTTVHLITSELIARGFGGQLLGSLFRFEDDQRPLFLVYAYKRGTFYPFVPSGDGQRDNAAELPIEQDLSRWFPLYDAPL